MRRTNVRSGLFFLFFLLYVAAPSAAGARELTFEDRVAAQEAIERVYYRHQEGATLPFEQAVSREVLERKVRGFLERSEALERFWNTTIDEDALRREWQRIERQSPYPARLREIYAALGNDPVLIAECFVRPTLIQRLTQSFFEHDERIQGDARARAEALRAKGPRDDASILEYAVVDRPSAGKSATTIEMTREEYDAWRAELGPIEEGPLGFTVRRVLSEDADGARVAETLVPRRSWQDWWAKDARSLGFEARPVDTVWHSAGAAALAEVSTPRGSPGSCPADDTWDNGPFEDVPDHTERHAAVWSGTEMLVWGGLSENLRSYPAGWRYDPATDAWRRINKVGAPATRAELTAVWTGAEMLVWGGQAIEYFGNPTWMNSGGRYDPATDSWQPISLVGAPSARKLHTAVWTGTRMIVWGGATPTSPNVAGDGASYDPSTDTWTPISNVDAPLARKSHTAVWNGTEMIVWGGQNSSSAPFNSGARYNPSTDTWTPLPTADAPVARAFHTAVWTGTEMIVFGGTDSLGVKLQSGGRWNEASGWSATSLTGAPQPRGLHIAVWTGSHMLVWGGGIGGAYDNGRAYDPATNQWGPDFSSTNTPAQRLYHTGVWSGDRMIVWGGEAFSNPTFTGGRYDPASDTWTPTSNGGPAGEIGQFGLGGGSPTWTGTEFLFLSYRGPGYAYDPLTNSGRVIPPSGRPAGSTFVTTFLWTGNVALWWGESEGVSGIVPGHGLLYNPIGDVWTEMSLVDAPFARSGHSMVWTGSRMIMWAGFNNADSDYLANGAVYDPSTNLWIAAIPTENAPFKRFLHCAFWDGDEMIVYGGDQVVMQSRMSGGRFHLASNTWSPMTAGPLATANGCLWTGTDLYVGTTSRYNSATDTWTPLSPGPVPGTSSRARGWTGSELVLWGGPGPGGMGDVVCCTDAGARYDPTTDSWAPTSLAKAPGPRNVKWSAWIGDGFLYAVGGTNGGINPNSRDGGRYVVNLDTEGDGFPELCDNCPGLANADQADADLDDRGDACDLCTDTDGDSFGDPGFPVSTCALDNCPQDANPSQADFDVDGAGDPCDDCTDGDDDGAGNPGFPANLCADDNCAVVYNAVQRDTDADDIGDLCDLCPGSSDPAQADGDGDGAGDACDCQPIDPNDRTPGAVANITASQPVAGTIALAWSPAAGSDAYSITRGNLGLLGTGQYGACLAQGITATSYSDATVPSAGQGFAYLVQAQNYDCGLGSLGRDSTEAERTNGAGACAGNPHADSDATGEAAVFGTTTGTLGNVAASDNLVQTITEEITSGSPATRFSRLEHRWTFSVGAGSLEQLHVEGFRSASADGDDFRFEYSTDGVNFTAVTLASLPFADNGIDLVGALPAGISGTVTIRVVDTDRTPGNQSVDSVSLDQLFLRSAS